MDTHDLQCIRSTRGCLVGYCNCLRDLHLWPQLAEFLFQLLKFFPENVVGCSLRLVQLNSNVNTHQRSGFSLSGPFPIVIMRLVKSLDSSTGKIFRIDEAALSKPEMTNLTPNHQCQSTRLNTRNGNRRTMRSSKKGSSVLTFCAMKQETVVLSHWHDRYGLSSTLIIIIIIINHWLTITISSKHRNGAQCQECSAIHTNTSLAPLIIIMKMTF